MELNDDARLSVKQGLQFLALALAALAIFHGPVLIGSQVFCGGDTTNYFYPMRAAQARLGWFAGWLPESFSGYPLMDNVQSGMFYPQNWLHLLGLPIDRVMSMLTLLHLLIGGLGLFCFARQRMRFGGAALAGLVWSCCGLNVLRIANGVFTFPEAFAWIPWCWLAAEKQRLNRGDAAIMWTGLLAIFGALQFAVGAPQIAQITWVGIGIWTLARVYTEREWRREIILGFCAAGLLAAMACMPLLISAMRFQSQAAARHTGDAMSFLTHDSVTPHILATWIFPAIYAPGNAEGLYWEKDGNYFETNAYVGIAPLMLAAFALCCGVIAAKRKEISGEQARWLAACAVLGVFGFLMALGGNGLIFPILARFVPTFSLFRVPARWAIWTVLPVCIGAGAGLELVRGEFTRNYRNAWIVVCVLFVIGFGACYLFSAPLLDALGLNALLGARGADDAAAATIREYANSSLLKAFAIAGAFAVVVALLRCSPRWRVGIAPFALLLCVGDLHSYWRPFCDVIPTEIAHRDLATEAPYHLIAADKFRDYFYPETELVKELRKEPGRVDYTDVFISYLYDQESREISTERPAVQLIEMVRGYQQLQLVSYISDYYSSFVLPDNGVPGGMLSTMEVRDRRVLDAYNVSAVLSQTYPAMDQMLAGIGLTEARPLDAHDMMLRPNHSARGWAWLSASGEFLDAVPDAAAGTVTMDKRDPELWSGSVDAKKECWLHLSSPEYSGWQLVVKDEAGERIDPENSRTVHLPAAGKYVFERSFYRIGLKPSNLLMALIAVGISCAMVVGGWRRRRMGE